ncbi:hypothetical protein J6T21_00900 [Candidatus Saccharibacteria bacterium]|nr:hypothetical protein [Candidatus Saccharibacteria bacterium]
MLKAIVNFAGESWWHLVILVVIYYAFWPGLMFINGWVFESRLVPFWKGQSKAFLPGDFSLGIAAVAFISMYVKNPCYGRVYSIWYWFATAAICAVLASIWRHVDISNCPRDIWYTPTKLTHDICGYFICMWILVSLGVPQLIWAIGNGFNFGKCSTEWIVFAACVAFYLAWGIYDLTHPATPEEVAMRHPGKGQYKPIWKR